MPTDTTPTAAEMARRVLELLADATRADVRARVEIGALLIAHGRELHAIAREVGVSARALYHATEVRQRFTDAEIAACLEGPRVPPWSALVAVSGVTPRGRRARMLREWLEGGGGVRGLRKKACGR